MEMAGIDSKLLLDVFKLAPAIAALLVVIYLMYRIIINKDEVIKQLVVKSQSDIEQQSKMVTLLEILVNRAEKKGGSS
jgi:type IV secretory pathway VirB3-like protein